MTEAKDSPSGSPPTCPRCGTPAQGAVWCPRCGLNLRGLQQGQPKLVGGDPPTVQQASTAQAAPGTQPPPPPPASPPSSRRFVAMASIVLLGAAAIVATVLLVTRGGGSHPSPAPISTVSRRPTTSTTISGGTQTVAPVRASTISLSSVRGLLGEYISAYDNEDVGALRALFADDLVRQNGRDAPQGLADALTTYQTQFSQLSNPDYALSNVSVSRFGGEAVVSAEYSITSSNGTVTGSIRFHVVRRAGRLLIDQLVIRPNG